MKWLKKAARPRILWTALAAAVLCEVLFAFVFLAMRPHGVTTTLDMMTGFSYADARSHLALYSEPVRVLHGYFWLIDLAFPLTYGLLFAAAIAWLLGMSFPSQDRLLLLGAVPLVGMLFDFVENIGIFAMVRIYPEPFETWSKITSTAGVLKMVGFYASLLSILGLTVILILKRIRARWRPSV